MLVLYAQDDVNRRGTLFLRTDGSGGAHHLAIAASEPLHLSDVQGTTGHLELSGSLMQA